MTEFWYDNINELYNKNKLLHFWPVKGMSHEDKFNSLSRFLLYAGVLISSYHTNSTYLILCIFLVLFLALASKNDTKLKEKQARSSKKLAHHNNPRTMKTKERCQEPSKHNPFANVLMNDYNDNPEKAPACPYENVKEEVKDKFVQGLFRDITDIYDNENSQRQFYTTANSKIPNDQLNFAKWLYEKRDNCKTNPSTCTGFDGSPSGGSR